MDDLFKHRVWLSAGDGLHVYEQERRASSTQRLRLLGGLQNFLSVTPLLEAGDKSVRVQAERFGVSSVNVGIAP